MRATTAFVRACAGLAVLLGAITPSGAAETTLTVVAVPRAPLPGPAVLHAPLATTPILEDAGGWPAAPLMVSGTDAYAAGEYLYQDFVYDSFGANTTDGPLAPDPVPSAGDSSFGGPTGDVVYPTDAATYAFDAADLLEFRARLDPAGIAYRVTLNTMLAPDVAAVAIGIDTDTNPATGSNEWGYGIGSLGTLGLEHVLVSWGPAAELDGAAVASTVDVRRNQIEITTPLRPGAATWRHYLVVGLFDAATKTFKAIAEEPTETQPGGAHLTDPPPVFNAGFRFDEPIGGAVVGSGSRSAGAGNMRDHGQALALAARDISALHADISFAKLSDRVSESHVPTSGHLNRLYVSHLVLGEGAQPQRPMFRGPIQPYAVYVPTTYRAGTPAPLHLWLHSLAASYNQYAMFAPNSLDQLGEQRGSFVLTPEGRGPDGWYHDEAEVDVFEAWADLAALYDIDASRVTIGGYSMGGYGTYRLASLYPDLFAKGYAVVGPADEDLLGGPTGGALGGAQSTFEILANVRNLPMLLWQGVIDELVPVAGSIQVGQRLHDLGYRFEQDLFPTHDHFLFSILDEWGPGRDFLGDATVDADPSRVTYRVVAAQNAPDLGIVHDHAYWISGVTLAPGASSALVDARSLAHGEGEPRVSLVAGAGLDPAPHIKRGLTWTATTAAARAGLEITLEGVSSLTLWPQAAGVDATRPFDLTITSETPVDIVLATAAGARRLTASAGTTQATVAISPSPGSRGGARPRTRAPAPRSDDLPATGVGSPVAAAVVMLVAAAVLFAALRRGARHRS